VKEDVKKLYIIGAGGFGRETADIVRAINGRRPTWDIAGYIDDDADKWGQVVNDIPVAGGIEFLRERNGGEDRPRVVMAIGDPETKMKIAGKLGDDIAWTNIIHPSALVSPYSAIGVGNIVQAQVFIGPNVRVGDHCCINFCSSVGHDATFENFVSVMSHCDITGYCALGEGAYMATSVAVIPNTKIGAGAFIGAGSVVLKDVRAGAKALGYPAKEIELRAV
jgi:sugar O-acyltransferase (sialic acid O-acetyltransferase NeuD family)